MISDKTLVELTAKFEATKKDGSVLERNRSLVAMDLASREVMPDLLASVSRVIELEKALELIMQTLTIPAAEYVPAIGDVFLIIQRLQRV